MKDQQEATLQERLRVSMDDHVDAHGCLGPCAEHAALFREAADMLEAKDAAMREIFNLTRRILGIFPASDHQTALNGVDESAQRIPTATSRTVSYPNAGGRMSIPPNATEATLQERARTMGLAMAQRGLPAPSLHALDAAHDLFCEVADALDSAVESNRKLAQQCLAQQAALDNAPPEMKAYYINVAAEKEREIALLRSENAELRQAIVAEFVPRADYEKLKAASATPCCLKPGKSHPGCGCACHWSA